MIFAFDFPDLLEDGIGRPYHNGQRVKFNGLIDLLKDRQPYYGPAPPSLIDLLIKSKKDFKVLVGSIYRGNNKKICKNAKNC